MFFVVIIWLINIYAAGVVIPFSQIMAAALLFSFFHMLMSFSFWNLWSRSIKDRFLGGLVAFFTIFFIKVYALDIVHVWLPKIGVNFQDPQKAFSVYEFRDRITTAFMFTIVTAFLHVVFGKYLVNQRLLKEARKSREKMLIVIEGLKSKVLAKHLCPHFIENILSIAMGKLTIGNREHFLRILLLLVDVMRYAIDMANTDQDVSWEREITCVNKMIELIQVVNGKDSVLIDDLDDKLDIELPIGLLVMPVENSIKYGSISKASPLHITISKGGNTWRFDCRNRFNDQKRETVRSSKLGLKLMQGRLINERWPISMEIEEREDRFWMRLIGSLEKRCYSYYG